MADGADAPYVVKNGPMKTDEEQDHISFAEHQAAANHMHDGGDSPPYVVTNNTRHADAVAHRTIGGPKPQNKTEHQRRHGNLLDPMSKHNKTEHQRKKSKIMHRIYAFIKKLTKKGLLP